MFCDSVMVERKEIKKTFHVEKKAAMLRHDKLYGTLSLKIVSLFKVSNLIPKVFHVKDPQSQPPVLKNVPPGSPI